MIKAMATTTRRKALRRRKPQPGASPHSNPDYPVKPRVDPETGHDYTIVSVRLNGRSFLATIAEDQSVQAKASSRQIAEKNAANTYLEKLEAQSPTKRNRTPAPASRLSDLLKIRIVYDTTTCQYESHVPELNGISTCGPSKEETLRRTKELIRGYIRSMEANRLKLPLSQVKLDQVKKLVRA